MAELERIDRDELRRLIERGGDGVVLVDALSPMSYAASHLPGAVNLTPRTVDADATRKVPDRTAEIVVYCSSETCDSSVAVGQRLRELGYANVRHYVGGKADWIAAGLPLEGGRAS